MQHNYKSIVKNPNPFIIAEIGSNHNGDMGLAKKLIRAAKKSGADAAKFQSFTKESLFIKDFYKKENQFVDKKFGTLRQMVEKFSLSKEKHMVLKKACRKERITFFSTAFSPAEIDMLCDLGVPFLKVASMDLNNLGFLKYIAGKGKPIILSTGMGSLAEIKTALNVIYKANNKKVVLMHCVSMYPPGDRLVNLKNITLLKKTFKIPVGFSDHTVGTSLSLAAIALGAKVIEKHFTIDKTLPGWDHAVSADPKEMKEIVEEGRRIVKALGSHDRTLSRDEIKQRKSFRRSIVAGKRFEKGEVLMEKDLDFKRPGTGIPPNELKRVLGRKIKKDIEIDKLILWEDLI